MCRPKILSSLHILLKLIIDHSVEALRWLIVTHIACMGDMACMARLMHDFLFIYLFCFTLLCYLFDLSIHFYYYYFDHLKKSSFYSFILI